MPVSNSTCGGDQVVAGMGQPASPSAKRVGRIPVLLDPQVFGTWTSAPHGEVLAGSPSLDCRIMAPGESSQEIHRNQALIAAAPDLARACLAMLDAYGNCGTLPQQAAGRAAGEALRKAGIIE